MDSSRPQNPIKPGWAVVLFTLLMLVMVGHQAEHLAQMIQKWTGSPCPFECSGLLGSHFDVEWVHWIYNSSSFVILIIIWLGLRMWEPAARAFRPWAWWSLTLGIFVVQGYHVIEHSAKIGQWLINGHHSPTPGLFGTLLPPPTQYSFSLIEMHFTINTIVFLAVTAGYLGFVIWRLVPASLKINIKYPWQTAALILMALMITGLSFWATGEFL